MDWDDELRWIGLPLANRADLLAEASEREARDRAEAEDLGSEDGDPWFGVAAEGPGDP